MAGSSNPGELPGLREELVSRANPETSGLPVLFWSAILGLIAAGFCLAAFTAPTLGRTVAAGVRLPFEGDTSVSPRPLQKAPILHAKRQ
jgi:hypothetical protein